MARVQREIIRPTFGTGTPPYRERCSGSGGGGGDVVYILLKDGVGHPTNVQHQELQRRSLEQHFPNQVKKAILKQTIS